MRFGSISFSTGVSRFVWLPGAFPAALVNRMYPKRVPLPGSVPVPVPVPGEVPANGSVVLPLLEPPQPASTRIRADNKRMATL